MKLSKAEKRDLWIPSTVQGARQVWQELVVIFGGVHPSWTSRQAVYDGLAAQKNELSLALKSGGSAVQDMIDKAVRIENQAADVQKDLDQTNARIKNEKA